MITSATYNAYSDELRSEAVWCKHNTALTAKQIVAMFAIRNSASLYEWAKRPADLPRVPLTRQAQLRIAADDVRTGTDPATALAAVEAEGQETNDVAEPINDASQPDEPAPTPPGTLEVVPTPGAIATIEAGPLAELVDLVTENRTYRDRLAAAEQALAQARSDAELADVRHRQEIADLTSRLELAAVDLAAAKTTIGHQARDLQTLMDAQLVIQLSRATPIT